MVSSIRPSGFQKLPHELQLAVAKFFSPETLANNATISSYFKKIMENPLIWNLLGHRMNFKVDTNNSKQSFLLQYISSINKILLEKVRDQDLHPIRKLPAFEQRKAIEKYISTLPRDSWDITLLGRDLGLKLDKSSSANNTQNKAMLKLLLHNGSGYLCCAIFQDTRGLLNTLADPDMREITFKAIEKVKKSKWGTPDGEIWDWVICQPDPSIYTDRLQTAGIKPSLENFAQAIMRIVLATTSEDRKKFEALFEKLIPNKSFLEHIKSLIIFADNLVEPLKKETHSADSYNKKKKEIISIIVSRIYEFLKSHNISSL